MNFSEVTKIIDDLLILHGSNEGINMAILIPLPNVYDELAEGYKIIIDENIVDNAAQRRIVEAVNKHGKLYIWTHYANRRVVMIYTPRE